MQLFCIRFGKLYVLAYPQPNVGSVVVGPKHVVDVEDDRLPGHVEHGRLVDLLRVLRWTAEWKPTAAIHGELWSLLLLFVVFLHSSDLMPFHKIEAVVHPRRPDGQLLVDSHFLADSFPHHRPSFKSALT